MQSLLASGLVSIRKEEYSGRGVYANQDIAEGTVILTSKPPAAFCIFKQYWREVCIQCFGYNLGIKCKIHDSCGVYFCNDECATAWRAINGEALIQDAYQRVTDLIRRKGRRKLDVEMGDVIPSREAVEQAWHEAELRAEHIKKARLDPNSSKKALRLAAAQDVEPDVVMHLLSAVLESYKAPAHWDTILELVPTDSAFSSHHQLRSYITSYHHLLTVLPVEFLPYTSADIVKDLARLSRNNCFGLRSLNTSKDGESIAGEEHFGIGTWPEASFFNHSCDPNTGKVRRGRSWEFWTLRTVRRNEQLCITYIGGDEKTDDAEARRRQLFEQWHFLCQCQRCGTLE